MVGIAVALGVAATLTWVVVRLGPTLGYVDRPDDPALKAHTTPAVPLGGVAIFIAIHTGLAIAGRFDIGLFAASGVLLVLGLIDDRVGLSPVSRLTVTAGAGVILALSSPDVGAGVYLVLVVIVTVNAVNLFDGLDGLAGSAAAVSGVAAAGLAAVRGTDVVPGMLVAAAIAGFLVFNWNPAKAFLGDNGAYVVALVLVWLIAGTGGGVIEVTAGLGVLGVFVVDLLVTVLRRKRAGAPLFAGDRSHIYDRLHQSGLSVAAVALTSAAAQVVLAGLTLFFVWWLSAGWALVATALMGLGTVTVLVFTNVLPSAAADRG